jgi:hypothetical protein
MSRNTLDGDRDTIEQAFSTGTELSMPALEDEHQS